MAYNLANGFDPTPLRKRSSDIAEMLARARTPALRSCWAVPAVSIPGQGAGAVALLEDGRRAGGLAGLPAAELGNLIQTLTDQMHARRESSYSSWRPAARRDR